MCRRKLNPALNHMHNFIRQVDFNDSIFGHFSRTTRHLDWNIDIINNFLGYLQPQNRSECKNVVADIFWQNWDFCWFRNYRYIRWHHFKSEVKLIIFFMKEIRHIKTKTWTQNGQWRCHGVFASPLQNKSCPSSFNPKIILNVFKLD